jgi:general secretion pathway protein J
MHTHKTGFTLIEILIALSVFAIIATITSSIMYQTFHQRDIVTAQANRLLNLQLAITLLNHDIEQIVERNIADNQHHIFPAFIGKSQQMTFTRNGNANPGGIEARSTMQRVTLICKDHSLIRRSSNELDMPKQNQYIDKTLITGLRHCQFSYLTQKLELIKTWQTPAPAANQKSLPKAIQINLDLTDWGKMSMLFIVGGTIT